MSRRVRLLFASCAVLLCTAAGAQPANPAGNAPASPMSVRAPPSVRALLVKHLDLPTQLAGDNAEFVLTRRVDKAATELLATEGYFVPRIEVRRTDGDAAGLVIDVDPGPHTTVAAVAIEFTGDLAGEGDERAARHQRLPDEWPLKSGAVFRSADWTAAKAALLANVAAADSRAEIDPAALTARLLVVIEAGTAYRFGALAVEGLKLVQGLAPFAPFAPGDAYRRDALLNFQTLLQNTPWFHSVMVEADSLAATGGVVPVRVTLEETQSRRVGALEIDASFAGTLTAPQLSGQVRGTGLAISLIDENIQLRDGELLIRFNGSQALVERLVFVAPYQPPARARRIANFPVLQAPGRLSISGELDLRQARARITATLARVSLAQRPERWVVAYGTVNPNHVGPRIESDIAFDLGEHFHLRAGGLAARLAGRLRMRGGERSGATGSIAASDATFEAYGQRLTVERGIVNFQGPLDDPGLNVLALRKGMPVEAGVTVTGTAKQPRVRLVSTPPVSDSEKLSWIILGRAPNATGTDSALLLAAAGAFLGGQGEGVISKLSQALGVDELALRQGGRDDSLAGQILVLGKRLSALTYLGYEQGLTAATGAVKLTHALTPRMSIATRAGEDSAIDIFYHFSFD